MMYDHLKYSTYFKQIYRTSRHVPTEINLVRLSLMRLTVRLTPIRQQPTNETVAKVCLQAVTFTTLRKSTRSGVTIQ